MCGFASNPFSYIKFHMAPRQIPFCGTPFIQPPEKHRFSRRRGRACLAGIDRFGVCFRDGPFEVSVESFPA
jgi:hypothetical protein